MGLSLKPTADLDHNAYWTNYFDMVRAEELWTEVELREVSYVEAAKDFQANITADDEVELSESEIKMTVDETGHSTPISYSIMVVKSTQGRACSRLLRVLCDSGGSKSMAKESILPRGARTDSSRGKILMNTLAGTHAPLGSACFKGMRLPAFDKNIIIDEHNSVVFDQPCNFDVILGGDF